MAKTSEGQPKGIFPSLVIDTLLGVLQNFSQCFYFLFLWPHNPLKPLILVEHVSLLLSRSEEWTVLSQGEDNPFQMAPRETTKAPGSTA